MAQINLSAKTGSHRIPISIPLTLRHLAKKTHLSREDRTYSWSSKCTSLKVSHQRAAQGWAIKHSCVMRTTCHLPASSKRVMMACRASSQGRRGTAFPSSQWSYMSILRAHSLRLMRCPVHSRPRRFLGLLQIRCIRNPLWLIHLYSSPRKRTCRVSALHTHIMGASNSRNSRT